MRLPVTFAPSHGHFPPCRCLGGRVHTCTHSCIHTHSAASELAKRWAHRTCVLLCQALCVRRSESRPGTDHRGEGLNRNGYAIEGHAPGDAAGKHVLSCLALLSSDEHGGLQMPQSAARGPCMIQQGRNQLPLKENISTVFFAQRQAVCCWIGLPTSQPPPTAASESGLRPLLQSLPHRDSPELYTMQALHRGSLPRQLRPGGSQFPHLHVSPLAGRALGCRR